MKKTLLSTLLLVSLMGTCGDRKWDRLEQEEKDHYTALKVWMDAKERKTYLKLKTRDERDGWLQAMDYWDRFYQYDARDREKILKGEVMKGWTLDMLTMSWGPAHLRKRMSGRQASRSEMLVYHFEIAADGRVLVWTPNSKETHTATGFYRMEIILDDGAIAEMNKRDGWE